MHSFQSVWLSQNDTRRLNPNYLDYSTKCTFSQITKVHRLTSLWKGLVCGNWIQSRDSLLSASGLQIPKYFWQYFKKMFIFVFTFMSEIASETEILCLLASLLSWSTYSCACCSTVIWAGISELIRKLGVLTLEQNFKIVASKFYPFFGKKHENYVYKFKSFTKVTFS